MSMNILRATANLTMGLFIKNLITEMNRFSFIIFFAFWSHDVHLCMVINEVVVRIS